MPRRLALLAIVVGAQVVASGDAMGAPASAAPASKPAAGKKGPRVFFTNSPPHTPNLVVVARAMSIDVSMRAAGISRMAHVADLPVTPPGTPGELYTDNPLEARTQQTRVDPGAQVVPVLREAWPELGELGARTLAAQFALETGSGRHCYNFNLGNHKGGGKEPHMYLRGVWEGVARGELERLQAEPTFGSLVQEESAAQVHAKGHLVPPGKIVVLLGPPHPGARFRANANLEEGVARFAALHRRIADKSAGYLPTLRAGDSAGVARILGSSEVRYYTGNVEAYAQGMMNHRDIIDEGLGPAV